ncbi:hypothetical protein QFZ40_000709 [Arthrobacter pascens]|uniref:hypothetical protein n=1 Tax=Arthrobacter pascens TaxID=1677 RepID=UPI0027879A9C|nr:hypothetical protein [Arthrobacter pascens]MDQ0632800.1 hypothetical protein [Arthrobacter pascens]
MTTCRIAALATTNNDDGGRRLTVLSAVVVPCTAPSMYSTASTLERSVNDDQTH